MSHHHPNLSAGLNVAAAQFTSTPEIEENLRAIATLARRAKQGGADLVVFPEAAMFEWHAPAEQIALAAQHHGEQFCDSLAELARQESVTLVAGAFVPDDGHGTRNRMVAYGADGEKLGHYDKVHLYDAFNYRESDKIHAAIPDGRGSELCVIPAGPFNLGLLNCYDLRFPEIARALIDAGADTFLVSSAWVSGPHKEAHWETLLRARGIENTCYVIAANQPAPASVGLSTIIDPLGVTLDVCTSTFGLASGELSRARLDEVRAIVPSLQHRKYDVVAKK